jgi:hypothetical protein
MTNVFMLYESSAHWREAEAGLKAACQRAAAEIRPIQDQHSGCGASDTESREAITTYIYELLMGPSPPDPDEVERSLIRDYERGQVEFRKATGRPPRPEDLDR